MRQSDEYLDATYAMHKAINLSSTDKAIPIIFRFGIT